MSLNATSGYPARDLSFTPFQSGIFQILEVGTGTCKHMLQRKDTRPRKNTKPLYTETKACGDHKSPLLGVVECMQTLPRAFRKDTAGLQGWRGRYEGLQGVVRRWRNPE